MLPKAITLIPFSQCLNEGMSIENSGIGSADSSNWLRRALITPMLRINILRLRLFTSSADHKKSGLFFGPLLLCLKNVDSFVEMEGLEPSSKQATQLLSTCLVFTLFSSWSRLKTTYFKPSFVGFRNVKEAITDLGLL